FAHAAKALNWDGPVVAMTDCTKVHLKLSYSQELGCIMGSILSFDQAKVETYDDIHIKINEIRANNSTATQ
ncbi:22354_t:CDS:1, partial [Entrophospora sp. SA101]